MYNQFTESFSVKELAEMVTKAANSLDIETTVKNIENPRVEKEEHYYNAMATKLIDLGLEPHLLTQEVLVDILKAAIEHKERVIKDNVMPKVTWK